VTARIEVDHSEDCPTRIRGGRCTCEVQVSARNVTEPVKARITTRAGRKIRHVAPGHVVDVATGQGLWRYNAPGFMPRAVWMGMEPGSGAWLDWWVARRPEREDRAPKQFTLGRMVPLLVRVMLAIGGWGIEERNRLADSIIEELALEEQLVRGACGVVSGLIEAWQAIGGWS